MNSELPPYLFSFILPAGLLLLALVAVANRVLRRPVGAWCLVALTVLAFGLVALPVGGLPLARWITTFCGSPSLPLIALLATALGRRALNLNLLRQAEVRTTANFGLVAGLVLYPLAMGLGPFDPYALGWDFSALHVVVGALTVWWLWRGNRFGLVLLGAIAACQLGLMESGNYWDYLVDPICFIVSLVMVGRRFLRSRLQTNPPVANPVAAA